MGGLSSISEPGRGTTVRVTVPFRADSISINRLAKPALDSSFQWVQGRSAWPGSPASASEDVESACTSSRSASLSRLIKRVTIANRKLAERPHISTPTNFLPGTAFATFEGGQGRGADCRITGRGEVDSHSQVANNNSSDRNRPTANRQHMQANNQAREPITSTAERSVPNR